MPPMRNLTGPPPPGGGEKVTINNVNKVKTNRRALKCNKRKAHNNSDFTIYANNCDKLGNKLETFNKVLNDLTPSVFILEETKRKLADPPLKVSNLNKGDAGNVILNTKSKNASAIFSACKAPMSVTLLSYL